MATYYDLQNIARQRGCALEVDEDCQCYRFTAPKGQRFELGLHEVIAVFGVGILGNGATRAEARDDLYERITTDVRYLEDCDDERCDWCSSD